MDSCRITPSIGSWTIALDITCPSRGSRRRLLCRDLCRAGSEVGIKLACLLPTQHVERFDELADTVNLGAEQAKLDNFFICEEFGKVGIDLVFIDGMLTLLEQISVMQRGLLARAEARLCLPCLRQSNTQDICRLRRRDRW